VTRAEYDDLKSRFDTLEATMARILPAFSVTAHPSTMSPGMPLASTSAIESAHAPILPPYRAQSSNSPTAVYRMPSPQASARNEPPFPASSSIATRSPQTSYRVPTSYTQPRPPRAMPSPPTVPRVPSPAPPLTSSSRLPDTRLPSSRRASLSLAAITTPYSPEGGLYGQTQPKNYRAQTLPLLGLRLRKALAQTGPAARLRHRAHHSMSTHRFLAREAILILRLKRCRHPARSPHRQRPPQATFRRQCQFRFLLEHHTVVIPASPSAIPVVNSGRSAPSCFGI
jgi:hypothetical protein